MKTWVLQHFVERLLRRRICLASRAAVIVEHCPNLPQPFRLSLCGCGCKPVHIDLYGLIADLHGIHVTPEFVQRCACAFSTSYQQRFGLLHSPPEFGFADRLRNERGRRHQAKQRDGKAKSSHPRGLRIGGANCSRRAYMVAPPTTAKTNAIPTSARMLIRSRLLRNVCGRGDSIWIGRACGLSSAANARSRPSAFERPL